MSKNNPPLTHPRRRLPLRADFPPVKNMRRPKDMFHAFEQECAKQYGRVPASVIIAWPHKNPQKFDHLPDEDYVSDFVEMARAAYPQTRFFLADGLFEQRSLARASDTADTRYNKSQRWKLSKKFQTETLPPLNGTAIVVLDDAVETGATFAEFISFLHHNGAYVLMAAVPSMTDPVQLQFARSPEQDGRLNLLDEDLREAALAAGVEMKPGECVALIERALNKKGHSLTTLTPGEFQEMRDEFAPAPRRTNFFEFLHELGGTLPRRLKTGFPNPRS